MDYVKTIYKQYNNFYLSLKGFNFFTSALEEMGLHAVSSMQPEGWNRNRGDLGRQRGRTAATAAAAAADSYIQMKFDWRVIETSIDLSN